MGGISTTAYANESLPAVAANRRTRFHFGSPFCVSVQGSACDGAFADYRFHAESDFFSTCPYAVPPQCAAWDRICLVGPPPKLGPATVSVGGGQEPLRGLGHAGRILGPRMKGWASALRTTFGDRRPARASRSRNEIVTPSEKRIATRFLETGVELAACRRTQHRQSSCGHSSRPNPLDPDRTCAQ